MHAFGTPRLSAQSPYGSASGHAYPTCWSRLFGTPSGSSLCSSLRENLGLIPPPVKTDASERLMIFQACEFLCVAKEGTLEACARACLAALGA